MVDDATHGRRPMLREGRPAAATANRAMAVCPGASLSHDELDEYDDALIQELLPGWGPVLELWEGWAADDDLRWAGSSGGGASSLALACLEAQQYHGVLHIAQREDIPILNHTVMSHQRDQLLQRAGSRYAPASPCDRLDLIEQADDPCVMIGKPCDIAAAQRARKLSEKLDANLGLTIGIFCAGTPNLKATMLLLKRLGIDDWTQMQTLRYRGNGWPGHMQATRHHDDDNQPPLDRITYAQGWDHILQKHRQWRCYICPDHTGEFADVSVGDPWYREIEEGEAGSSLFVIRTERGRAAFHAAMASGHIQAKRCEPNILPASQPGLLQTRGSLAARLVTLRLMGAGVPRYRGFELWRFWWSTLSLKKKLQSFWGTAKRVFRRGLRQSVTIYPWSPDQPILEDRRP